ncbi:serine/threonine-protein kinase [Oerskovia flava]|uniref:serine/threonine-protein kinase n=1 Tax=Oerskovia flava TaxID=2986422 RepID=UPI00223F359D|nr:serine/threonine-protein kinase [Oerskovia sp. JB1-3-2]
MRPVEGLALGNRYQLVRRVAIGGMGEVWVATDHALGREVAVKVLREEYAGNEDFLNRLRTEARNSAALSHPNIAQMYDYGEQQSSGYLVMELVVGEPMADLLEREPVLPPARLLPILSQTARALEAAHMAGVVHRDVKPGNILLDRSGEVKITDFGVSLAANQVPMTAAGMVMGTAQYLSPEQAIGQAATGASDIYALGIVAYESVAGNRPFTGSTPVDIAVAHVNEQVPPLPGSVHPDLARLILTMLAKDPAGRPPSAGLLAETFDALAIRIARDPWGATSITDESHPEGQPATRRARRATRPADGPTATPEPGTATPVRPVEPVITSMAIPETVRADAPADEVPDDESPAPQHEAALPWERPAPSSRSGTSRTYPPRREMHGQARTRPPSIRPAGRRPERPERPEHSGEQGPGAPSRREHAPERPGRGGSSVPGGTRAPAGATRSERRRASQNASPTPARTSTTTGLRIGGLAKGMSWPLLALLGLLLILLVATLLNRPDRTEPDALGEQIVTTSLLPAAHGTGDNVVPNGMILSTAVSTAVPTTLKDA